ncbi:hypothetical protein GUITHDRAFT_99198 [Guillardia theta CCMP2712]|uniref:B30.2/SPRY domain-containing protein n=2 Tax=Guillardia theta TaxID=55529 RepID=L1K493_GUITC|nr:hypothetical protein GUITHDRAFT_122493 [Guillardia theta CCMP2712]XP_005842399.1 hypothetical protein GUITHDRAFT_99198 [Guillardia theta CCMP2712]EKX31308.1 hypothetical protein GUITHDRAFT_122493 [Guillardia theta CCMP2712]EKX55419.1 hypothetical protein GUITHDRAFT_99198 [Guillardia theta CCMP2712]|eukprot:XP_005818288.1 hypothetical protein GUITHDRAFT_122493 [Guillardia theta CCMP2712]
MNGTMSHLFSDSRSESSEKTKVVRDYELKKYGLVPTGNRKVVLEKQRTEIPGMGRDAISWGYGLAWNVLVQDNMDSIIRHCPLVACRQIFTAGMHKFEILVREKEHATFLPQTGQIKIGFFRSDVSEKDCWMSAQRVGKAWYYSSMGNVYDGNRSDRSTSYPSFDQGDIVIAILNANSNTATFQKRKRLRSTMNSEERMIDTPQITISNLQPPPLPQGFRFGVQFEKKDSGIVLLSYEDISADDSLKRAEGWKKLGLECIQDGRWQDAISCFQKSAKFFHEINNKAHRRMVKEFLEEAKVLLESHGIGSAGETPFTRIGVNPGAGRQR